MSDDHIARPVSGEIMSGPSEARRPGASHGDVHDAEFESLPVHSAAAPPFARRHAAATSPEPLSVLQRGAVHAGRQRGGPLFWTFGAILVFAAFWISGGHALFAPAMESPPAAATVVPAPAGLAITGVTSRLVRDGQRMLLTVDGEVANGSDETRPVPPLSIRVTDAEGAVVRYRLGTGDTMLSPGSSFPFSGRLAAPETGLGTVTVDFAARE